ncbi:hypothetical protein LPJ59_000841 [Coemansia sp. RSA 2399]|nr:hypothetical protein LPJ59_000841 [Coemansia sp. RSA 2399]KAJ1896776.1 hypothetical protein LPJ81_004668 [Coemansia sp. IMI 209127]
MPVNMSCGTSANADIINTVGQADGYPTPLPTGTVMQRIASYHPGVPIAATAQQQALIGNSMNGSADGVGFSFAPAKVPVNRLNTTTAVMASASSNTESSVFDGNIQAASPPPAHRKVAHNAIERRYRNNINDRIRDLRNSVPALQNIRAKGSKQQRLGGVDINNEENDDDIDDENDTEEVAIVDGVVAATKLNKATVLGKSTEYIYHLRRNNDLYKRESLYLQEMIRKMPDGDKVIARVLQMTRRDSAVATAALFMPESSSPPRPKKRRRT